MSGHRGATRLLTKEQQGSIAEIRSRHDPNIMGGNGRATGTWWLMMHGSIRPRYTELRYRDDFTGRLLRAWAIDKDGSYREVKVK